MEFSLDLIDDNDTPDFQEELEKSYCLAEKAGTIVSFSCFGTDFRGNIVRRPAVKKNDFRHADPEYFQKFDNVDELVPCFILGQTNVKNKYLVCVDIDVKKGKDGKKSIDEMFPGLRDTATVREETASGGEHLYFYADEPLPVWLEALEGVDLLGVQKGAPRVCFCPPALGKDLEKRHKWITDPRKNEILFLPESIKEFWKNGRKKQEKIEKKATEKLDDFLLFSSVIPRALERNTNRDNEPIGGRESKDLGFFLDALALSPPGTCAWEEGKIPRTCWLNIAYLCLKLNLPDDTDAREVCEKICAYFPGFDSEMFNSNFDSLEGVENIRIGGRTVNQISRVGIIKEEFNRFTTEFLGGIESIYDGDNEKTNQEEEEEIDFEEIIEERNKKIKKLIEKKKKTNAFYGACKAIDEAWKGSSGIDVLASVASVAPTLSAVTQYDIGVDIGQGATNVSMFSLVFAHSGTGKNFIKRFNNDLSSFLGYASTGVVKSGATLRQQWRKGRVPKESFFLIDEIKTSSMKKVLSKNTKEDNEMKGILSEAHGDLCVTGQHTTDNNTGSLLQGAMASCLFFTSFSDNKDSYVNEMDRDQGILNRFFPYLPKKNNNTINAVRNKTIEERKKEIRERYGDAGVSKAQKAKDSFFDTFSEQLIWIHKKGMGRYPKGRYEYYDKLYPLDVNIATGDFIYDPMILEQQAEEQEQEGKKKLTRQEKKEKEALLQRKVYDTFNPWKPVVLVFEDFEKQVELEALAEEKIEKYKIVSGGKKDLERFFFHVIRLAGLIEALDKKYFEKNTAPKKISNESAEEAYLLVESLYDAWIHRSAPYFDKYEYKSFSTQDKQGEKEHRSEIVQNAIRQTILKTGKEDCSFREIRGRVKSVAKHAVTLEEMISSGEIVGVQTIQTGQSIRFSISE